MVGDAYLASHPNLLRMVKRVFPFRAAMLLSLFAMMIAREELAGAYERLFIDRVVVQEDNFHEAGSKDLLPKLGWWRSVGEMAKVAARAPEGAVFGLSEYGLVGAACPDVILLDPLGLHDRRVAHNGFSAEEFLARQPDLIWLPHSDYTRIVKEILGAQEFQRSYDFYPGALDYGLALRRSSPYFIQLRNEVRAMWQANYPSHAMEDYLARPIARGAVAQ